jgi:hypothetical protein
MEVMKIVTGQLVKITNGDVMMAKNVSLWRTSVIKTGTVMTAVTNSIAIPSSLWSVPTHLGHVTTTLSASRSTNSVTASMTVLIAPTKDCVARKMSALE